MEQAVISFCVVRDVLEIDGHQGERRDLGLLSSRKQAYGYQCVVKE